MYIYIYIENKNVNIDNRLLIGNPMSRIFEIRLDQTIFTRKKNGQTGDIFYTKNENNMIYNYSFYSITPSD